APISQDPLQAGGEIGLKQDLAWVWGILNAKQNNQLPVEQIPGMTDLPRVYDNSPQQVQEALVDAASMIASTRAKNSKGQPAEKPLRDFLIKASKGKDDAGNLTTAAQTAKAALEGRTMPLPDLMQATSMVPDNAQALMPNSIPAGTQSQ